MAVLESPLGDQAPQLRLTRREIREAAASRLALREQRIQDHLPQPDPLDGAQDRLHVPHRLLEQVRPAGEVRGHQFPCKREVRMVREQHDAQWGVAFAQLPALA